MIGGFQGRSSVLICCDCRCTCRHPGCRKHLLPCCRYASARLRTAACRALPQPVGWLGWLGRPRCWQVPHILHVQQSMVAAPALVPFLAQLVPDLVPPPALLVQALAPWITATQAQLAQAVLSHQLEPLCWRQLSELLVLENVLVPAGQLVFPTAPTSRTSPLWGWTRRSISRLPRLLSGTQRDNEAPLWRSWKLSAT